MIRVLLADDHTLVRKGLRFLLERADDVAVAGEASSGPETVALAKANQPDVVLLDIAMPGRDSLDVLKDLKNLPVAPRVLVLSMFPEDQYGPRFLREGADGYLHKDAPPDTLLDAIRHIHQGRKYVSPDLAEQLALRLDPHVGRRPLEGLSDREFQVLRRIGAGKTISEIGTELGLSTKTVSTYRQRALTKLGLSNNAQLMRYAFEQRLVDPAPDRDSNGH
jgi:DNA-binding NarL/FixJ family response regulator